MAHRETLIARALDTLKLIEQAVVRDTIARLPEGIERNAQSMLDVIQQRTDNAVRIYCAENVADALSHLQRE